MGLVHERIRRYSSLAHKKAWLTTARVTKIIHLSNKIVTVIQDEIFQTDHVAAGPIKEASQGSIILKSRQNPIISLASKNRISWQEGERRPVKSLTSSIDGQKAAHISNEHVITEGPEGQK